MHSVFTQSSPLNKVSEKAHSFLSLVFTFMLNSNHTTWLEEASVGNAKQHSVGVGDGFSQFSGDPVLRTGTVFPIR
jgi:hypothetical protein